MASDDLVVPSDCPKPPQLAYHEYDEVNGDKPSRHPPPQAFEMEGDGEYITLTLDSKKNHQVTASEKGTICKRAKFIGTFSMSYAVESSSGEELAAPVSQRIKSVHQECSLPSCQLVSLNTTQHQVQIEALANTKVLVAIAFADLLYVHPEPQLAIFGVCARDRRQPSFTTVHAFKVTSPHEASKMVQSLRKLCSSGSQQPSCPDLPFRPQTPQSAPPFCPKIFGPPARASSQLPLRTLPPPSLNGGKTADHNQKWTSVTLTQSLSSVHQIKKQRDSDVRKRHNSESCMSKDDDRHGFRQKSHTFPSPSHSNGAHLKKAAPPPPLPTRQTCDDIKTQIASLEEEIAQMQVKLEEDGTKLGVAVKSNALSKDDIGGMKMKAHAQQKVLLEKKESLQRFQNLLKATIDTNPDLMSVRDCYGKDWFKPDWSRKSVEQALVKEPTGCFFVRESTSKEDTYVLSLKDIKGSVVHHLILKTEQHFFLKGAEHAGCKKLIALVFHLMNKKEVLPCVLKIPELPAVVLRSSVADEEEEEESEYVVPEFA